MPEIRRFIIQTCGAVKYLHTRNIVHRDLKTGNLLLDANMNIKVGDFGLAALLISQNDLGARRTTMCGTPNYLAPEILEKTGRGHNEKVDLWAIGIIAYTLAVGRAPFHAAKKEEIYKKLQAREYTWPDLSKHQNDISNDLRDLVSLLLVDEDDRPGPDLIVSHPFFRLGFIPANLDKNCVSRTPKWTNVRPPSAATISRGYSNDWWKMCKESGVGEYAPGKCFPLIGVKKLRSAVRDCEKEVSLGRQPVVPMPSGIVYLPFPETTNWPYSSLALTEISEERESSAEGQHLADIIPNEQKLRPTITAVIPSDDLSASSKENTEPRRPRVVERPAIPTKPIRTRSVRKVAEKQPTLSVAPKTIKAPTAVRVTKGRLRANTAAASQPAEESPAVSEQESKPPAARISSQPMRAITRRTASAQVVEQDKPKPKVEEVHIAEAYAVKTVPVTVTALPTSLRTHVRTASRVNDPLQLSHSTPIEVLERVQEFRRNIARALENKPTPRRREIQESLPFVSKWVDYSKKHGVGYVLDDGSIGCAMNATARYSVTHVVCRDGSRHLSRVAKDSSHLEKTPLEFYTDCDDDGIRIADVETDRRKSIALLWSKFGRYMCQQLGQAEGRPSSDGSITRPTIFVRFYQRLGSVGVWGFSDGSFQVRNHSHNGVYEPRLKELLQFNFPDHTKLVLSPDASWCNFTCLSVEAAEYLTKHNEIPFKYIRHREVLSSSLRNLLHGSGAETMSYRDITQANCLSKKLQFIGQVVSEWLKAGGLGCLTNEALQKPLAYDGPQIEDGKRQDWVTVGRYGGDDPRE